MIDSGLLIDTFEIIKNYLLNIVNRSLKEGVFPEILKKSIIIPIPKIEKTIKIEEFRPINILCTIEKMLETQSGYRKGHLCETALNFIIGEWKNKIDDGNKILAVFLPKSFRNY